MAEIKYKRSLTAFKIFQPAGVGCSASFTYEFLLYKR